MQRNPVELRQPQGEQLHLQVCETIGREYRVSASKEADSEQRGTAPKIDKDHENKRRTELEIRDSQKE